MRDVLPHIADELEERYRQALAGHRVQWDRALKGRIVALSANPLRDANGNIFGGLVTGEDVTDVRHRAIHDEALRKVATATANGQESAEILRLVAEGVCHLFNAETAGVVQFNSGRIDVLSNVRTDSSLPAPVKSVDPEDEVAVAKVASSGRASIIRINSESTGRMRELYDSGLRISAAAPIRVRATTWGALGIGLRENEHFGQDELDRLSEFADAAATAISSAAAWQHLSTLAYHDDLTELPNRRTFDEHLASTLITALRMERTVGVIIFDLDHFKEVNDNYGHLVGDRVLRKTAGVMRRSARTGEMVARLGGEEFGLILPDCTSESAVTAAERLCRAIRDANVLGMGVTVSAGVALSSTVQCQSETIMGAADQALYLAKRSGRNQVQLFHDTNDSA